MARSDLHLSATKLECYQAQLKVPFAFQVFIDTDFVAADCFAKPRGPMAVPVKTFLSQLV